MDEQHKRLWKSKMSESKGADPGSWPKRYLLSKFHSQVLQAPRNTVPPSPTSTRPKACITTTLV